MSNRLRTPEDEQPEISRKPAAKEKPAEGIADNFIVQYITGIVNAEKATKALPFVLFIALLGMIYIANTHLAEKNIRDIDKISKEVKELSYDYKTTKAALAFKSTLTQVRDKADSTLGLKEPTTPPQKITIEEGADNDH